MTSSQARKFLLALILMLSMEFVERWRQLNLAGSSAQVHHCRIAHHNMFRRTIWTARAAIRPTSRFGAKKRFAEKHTPPLSTPATPTSRLARIESRLPKFLRKYTVPLRNAPVSHITAFLILHEITAVVPLFGLTAVFHYTNWLPPCISEGKWISDYTEKFGKWVRKKKWISDDNGRGRWWGKGEKATRIVVELATAYAITKVLLPFRIVLSIWGTPWFARLTVLPITTKLGQLGQRLLAKKAAPVRSSTAAGSNAAGTGAVAGGVVPKYVK